MIGTILNHPVCIIAGCRELEQFGFKRIDAMALVDELPDVLQRPSSTGTRECHVLWAERALKSKDALEWLQRAIEQHGASEYLWQ